MFDLTAVDPRGGSYRVNSLGWGYLRELLQQLECDTAQMTIYNDGQLVEDEVAEQWGKTILKGLAEKYIYNIITKDDNFVVGFREDPLVSRSSLVCNIRDARKLDAVHEEWLKKFADFCISSGGFQQF